MPPDCGSLQRGCPQRRRKAIEQARAEIQQERVQARDALRAEVATLAVAGAEKILETSVDAKAHSEMLEKLAAEL